MQIRNSDASQRKSDGIRPSWLRKARSDGGARQGAEYWTRPGRYCDCRDGRGEDSAVRSWSWGETEMRRPRYPLVTILFY